jgi:hypothetical protein
MSKLKYIILALLFPCYVTVFSQNYKNVQIKKEAKDNYQLTVDGQPFFIKGTVGWEHIDCMQQHGANAIRVGFHDKAMLDKLHSTGLMALVNLPLKAERDGMNYSDSVAVEKQAQKVLKLVEEYKNHPIVLCWALGNELDYIPGNKPFNGKLWNAINDLAVRIHQIDPHHPVMTVIGSSLMEKIAQIVLLCPNLDLLGINAYGDIEKMPETLSKYGWNKPYVYTEWGVTGYWESPKTSWGAPWEENSREKAAKYVERYKNAILKEKSKCLGSFAFFWGARHETTSTWFNLYDYEGNESQAVEELQFLWTGKYPDNRAPVIDSLYIPGYTKGSSIIFMTSAVIKTFLKVSDPDHDNLRIIAEVKPEAIYAAYAGNGEVPPKPINGLILSLNSEEIIFKTPAIKGAYRLFVHVYDGNGHFATANIPFYVN